MVKLVGSWIYLLRGGFLALLLALSVDSGTQVYFLLSTISFLTLPYTVYSIWYQRFVARNWCTLCLVVQALLCVETFIAYKFFPETIPTFFNVKFLILLFIAGFVPIVTWWSIKPFLTKALQVFDLRRELQKIKFNELFVQATFENQWQIPPVFEGMRTGHMGNPKANIILTIVTNPLCAPCAMLHNEIERLLEHETDIQCRFVFLGPPIAQQIAEQFLSVIMDHQPALMASWYANVNQNTDSWLKAHKSADNVPDLSGELHLHARWCQLANITSTPTVFVNDRILPRAYQLKDVVKLEQIMQRASISTGAFN